MIPDPEDELRDAPDPDLFAEEARETGPQDDERLLELRLDQIVPRLESAP